MSRFNMPPGVSPSDIPGNEPVPRMVIYRKSYIEVDASGLTGTGPDSLCCLCALGGRKNLPRCRLALDGDAKAAFGGDCDHNDVIYKEAK